MLIAHVSDFHVVGRGQLFQNCFDTRSALERLVARLQGLRPRPDILIVSGDLGEDVGTEEYAYIGELLRSLGLPVLGVPGNHDIRKPFVEALPDFVQLSDDGFLCRVVENGDFSFIGLDTLVEGAGHGVLCVKRLAWLDAALAESKGKRCVVVMHHPPINTGMTSMDAIGLSEGKAALAELIRRHGGVELILCGHVHRAIQGTFAGVPVRVAPSSSHQIACDLAPGSPFRFAPEPQQFMLHVFGADSAPVTHTLYVQEFE